MAKRLQKDAVSILADRGSSCPRRRLVTNDVAWDAHFGWTARSAGRRIGANFSAGREALFIRPNESPCGSRCGAQWNCNGGLAVLCADADDQSDFVSRLARVSVIFPDWQQRMLRAAEPPGQYRVRVAKRAWTHEHDEFLRNEWHLLPVEEIARRLGRSVAAVNRRRCKLSIRRYDGDELTLRALQRATGRAGRKWREVIERGWLQVRLRVRGTGTKPVGCVTIDGVRSLLKRHPEVLDYRLLRPAVRIRLELDSLPEPPRYKRLLCTAANSVNAVPAGTTADAGRGEGQLSPAVDLVLRPSCAHIGGTAFWAPIYATLTCPRCGGAVSDYSPDGVYADALPKRDTDRAGGRTGFAGLRGFVLRCQELTVRRRREATAARERMPIPDHEEKERASAVRQTP